MAWNEIIGQHRAKQMIARAIHEQRVAHAYLFWGAEGIGKDALALEMAKTMNCEQPHVSAEHYPEACGVCRSCRQAQELQHPNIQFVFALPAVKSGGNDEGSPLLKLSDDQIKLIQEELAQKAENPYHNLSIPNATQIRIASIREIKKNVTMSSLGKGRRFVIVSEAGDMNQEAANAFLKTLEEPHEGITIILTTSRRDSILQTILSRCQQIRCDVLGEAEIAEALVLKIGVSADEARLVARLADGSFSKAVELLGENLKVARTEAVNMLRSMLKPKNYILNLLHAIEDIAGEKNRTKVEQMLILLLVWMRDAYALSVSGNTDLIINSDQAEEITNFVKHFGTSNIRGAVAAFENACASIRRNADLTLTLTTLALEIRTCIYKQ